MMEKRRAQLIADCIERISSGDQSINDCIRNYPRLEDEIKMAITLEKVLHEAANWELSEIKQRMNKSKLLANLPDREQSVTKIRDPRYTLQNLKRRFAMSWIIIVTTILSLISGGGVVFASGEALPGDVLYPVKTWIEDVRLAAASDETDVGLRFHFAETRVEEILALIDEGDLEDMDEAVHGYENQVMLLTQTLAKIKADDSDEAIRLRADLETKLQDQARKMEDMLESSDEANVFLQEQVRLMLQMNTELRQRINKEEEIPDENELPEGDETELEETEGEDQLSSSGEQNQQGKLDASLQVDDERATFNFNLGGKGANGVYAEVEGARFECSIDGDIATCPFSGVPENGNVTLHDKQTNKLLFTYSYEYAFAYEYSWQDEKNDNGGKGAHSGDGDKEMNHDGKEK